MRDFLAVHRRSVPFMFLGGFLILTIPLLLLIYRNQTATKAIESTIVPTIDQSRLASTDQSVVIGETTGRQIEQLPDLLIRIVLDDGSVNYFFPSGKQDRPKKIQINQEGIASFERIVLQDQTDGVFDTVDEFRASFGEPDTTITGSHFYGQDAQTYIFAENGVAVIAIGDTVYEVHNFLPTSVEEYVSKYGEDLAPTNEQPVQEVVVETPPPETISPTPVLE